MVQSPKKQWRLDQLKLSGDAAIETAQAMKGPQSNRLGLCPVSPQGLLMFGK